MVVNPSIVRRTAAVLAAAWLISGAAAAQPLSCDLSSYRAQAGLTAETEGGALVVTWDAADDEAVRLRLSIDRGTPVFDEIAVRAGAAEWTVLARGVRPEYSITTGMRRITHQQLDPLRKAGVPITQDVLGEHRWEALWDAPLNLSAPNLAGSGVMPPVEGIAGTDQPGLPRKPGEIHRATAVFAVANCTVRTDGARLVVAYPGVTLGPFTGRLEYTVFRGTNLVRQELVATTHEPWVAYKYDAGLKGFSIGADSRAMWRDTAGNWQSFAFGNQPPDPAPVPVYAANRLLLASQAGAGSLAVLPPPHKFFWMRRTARVLGNNWYRRDGEGSFAVGIGQPERDPGPISDVWALYSARPGTEQLMTMFLYPTAAKAPAAGDRVLAFTREDRFAALPGYKVMQHHVHMDPGARMTAAGPGARLPEIDAFRAAGINIMSVVSPVYFYYGQPPGGTEAEAVARTGNMPDDLLSPIRANSAAARAVSDRNFLLMVSQEVTNSPVGAHTDLLFSHPVYWDRRKPGQPFTEIDPRFGKVYHVSNAEDLMTMVEAENVLVSMPHPRSKGSTGYPDMIKDEWYFRHPSYHGIGVRWGMGLDGSERRTCEYRCLPLLDDMANWMVQRGLPPKYAIAISEVGDFAPGDDTYASAPVTYVRLDAVPSPDDQSPLIDALRRGDMFVTTGEVLVPHFEIRGTGSRRTLVADVQWTFPLAMVELVWGDGSTTGRQVIETPELPAFGSRRFKIPFEAQGKKWVRFAAWDVAHEGAIIQPQLLGPTGR
jgi:hypothetical protein